jgi:hypothetical protein
MERFIEREVIGQESCPLMLRWTFLDWGFVKAMIHYFPAEVSDRDPHDHPRPFVTLVLRGSYRDESWDWREFSWDPRKKKEWKNERTVERVRAGAFRFRRAEHLHIVETDEVGCWTLVVMGPVVRDWGFVRLTTGLWWEWGKYVQKFGGVVRCDAPADTMNVEFVSPEDAGYQRITDRPIEPPLEHVVPRVGDFVVISDPADVLGTWGGKVENVSGETAWIRDCEHHGVFTVKLDTVCKAPDEAALIERYYRRGSGA